MKNTICFLMFLTLAGCASSSDDGTDAILSGTATMTNEEANKTAIFWVCERAAFCKNAPDSAAAQCKQAGLKDYQDNNPASVRSAKNPCNSGEIGACSDAITATTCKEMLDESIPMPAACRKCNLE